MLSIDLGQDKYIISMNILTKATQYEKGDVVYLVDDTPLDVDEYDFQFDKSLAVTYTDVVLASKKVSMVAGRMALPYDVDVLLEIV